MGESTKYLLSQDEINRIAAIASKEAVKVYRDEQKKEGKKQENYKLKATRRMLSSYRRTKKSLEEEVKYTKEEEVTLKFKFIEEFMSRPDALVTRTEEKMVADEKKRQDQAYKIKRLENAVRLYGEECDKSNSEEGKRRFRELMSMYIDDEVLTVLEIAERENVSEKTVYKDLGIASSIIAVYLLGM